MAYPKGRVTDTAMTRGEIIGGCIYWPIYLIGLELALVWLFALLGTEFSDIRLNLCYFIVNFLAVAILFRRYLIASLSVIGRHFWPFLQAIVLGLAFYYLLTWLLSIVFGLLNLSPQSPNNDFVAGLVTSYQGAMVVCTVLLAPLVEETLSRGLIFSNLYRKSRIGAYVASTLVFSVIHVISFWGQLGWAQALLSSLSYAPAGIALAWTYEKSGTIWASIAVHGVINAVATGIMSAL